MDPRTNPYTPNAGAQPEIIVGRDDQLESFDVLLARLSRGRPEQSMIVTGLRGVGKTVLLGQFRRKAETAGWIPVEFEASKHDDSQFRQTIGSLLRSALYQLSPKTKWTDRMARAGTVLKAFTVSMDAMGNLQAGLDIGATEGLAHRGDLSQDLTDALVAIGEAAHEHRGSGIVLLIDEIQFLRPSQFEAIIQALHKCVQRNLPVTLVGAGLPHVAELAGDAKSYAERLFKFPRIGNLNEADSRRALADPAATEGVTFEEDALTRAVDITGGYPYFIQELGYAVWTIASDNRITEADIEAAAPIYEAKLDSSFFRVRLDRTTELQRAYLRAMAELGPEPQKASDVAAVLGRKSTELGPTRKELINMGLLYTPTHGYAAFTVPHFDKYLIRAIPQLDIPPHRRRGRP